MRTVLALALLSGLVPRSLPAAPPLPSVDPVDYAVLGARVFGDDDGLPQPTVHAITFDRTGYLWAGTQNGAARYNGRRFTAVDMPAGSNYVRAIAVSADGSLWFGREENGLVRLKDGRMTVFDVATGLPSDRVNALLETEEIGGRRLLWIGTNGGGVASWDGKAFSVHREGLPGDVVWGFALVSDADGRKRLVAATSGGLATFANGSFTRLALGPEDPRVSVSSVLQTVSKDGRRTLYAGTYGAGLLALSDGRLRRYDLADGLPNRLVTSLAATVSPDGVETLWIGTRGGGLASLSNGVLSVPHLSPAFREIYSLAATTAADGLSVLWIGTRGSGLLRFQPGRWRSFDAGTGLPAGQVSCFLETVGPDGMSTYWVGTNNGLASIRGTEVKRFDVAGGQLPGNEVASLAEIVDARGRSTLWVATLANGLARLEDGKWSFYSTKQGLFSDRVTRLLATREERGPVLWVGGDDGLAKLENGVQVAVLDHRSGLPKSPVLALLETAGPGGTTLWVGTRTALAKFHDGRLTVLHPPDGPPGVISLAEVVTPAGRRELWAGTRIGVGRLDLGSEAARWDYLTVATRPALPDRAVYQVQQDRALRVYVGTQKGVARLTPRSPTADDPAPFDVYTFTTLDGLPSQVCNWSSMKDRKGRIWVSTMAGASVLDPAREAAPDRTRDPLVIERVLVNGKERPLGRGAVLLPDEKNVSFEAALLSFDGEAATRYRTELAGFDPAPSDWRPDFRTDYTHLPAGSFTFRVWGRDQAGNVAGPVELPFSIRAALWQRWWAVALYAAALLLSSVALVRWRVATLRRKNEWLEAIVVERTRELTEARDQALLGTRTKSAFLANVSHELRTPLNAIIGYAELLIEELTDRDVKEALPDLAKIRGAARHQLGLVNDILDLSKIEAERVELHLTDFDVEALVHEVASTVKPLVSKNENRLDVRVAPDVGSMRADATRVKQVLLNLLSNASKFTRGGVVTLDVSRRAAAGGDTVLFAVTDSGIGMTRAQIAKLFQPFVQAEAHTATTYGGTGLGLTISKRICELMGGDISVASEPGVGSTFTVRLPARVAGV